MKFLLLLMPFYIHVVQSRNSSKCISMPLESATEDVATRCPPALFCKDDRCQCGVYPYELVKCNGTSSFILKLSIATFDEYRNVTTVGYSRILRYGHGTIRTELPRDPFSLNEFMCGSTNRTGTLCGRCLPDHYPLVYSFDVTCIPCPHARWNWVRYIMAAYLPLTLFYIVMVFSKINTTSSHLFAPILYCQTLAMPLILRGMVPEVNNDFPHTQTLLSKLLFSLYGIWNLDFFRFFYSDLCLGTDTLPTLALDYAIAVYPLLLIIISYLLITLHDRNYKIVTIPWTPFRILSAYFRKQWDVKASVANGFAAFSLFSNIKILSVSFDLLIPTRVYQLYPDHYNYTLGLYYAGDIEYFGKEHLPYALLAIAVMCVFVFMPMAILALYPFRWFQSFLNLFPVRWYILHTFVRSFYGFYKNGTQPGMRDYRWCASVFFFFRFSQFFVYALVDRITYTIIITMVVILLLVLIAIIQPFSSPYNSTISTVVLHLLCLFTLVTTGIVVSAMTATQYLYMYYTFGGILGVCPLLYFAGSFLYWMKRFAVDVVHRFRAWRNGYTAMSDDLPDRIENPESYPKENLAIFPVK